MNNLPLQPLVWQDLDEDPMLAPVSISESPLHHYVVLKDGEGIKVRYSKKGADFDYATGFATIDEAKQWAWKHYNEKMQPYVKPMPTWIDVNERLPEQNTEVLVRYHAHFDDEDVEEFDVCTAFFYGSIFDVKDQHFYTRRIAKVTHWMPIPEFSTMQNNKGE